ncbi:MAG TPA: sigma factor, partial [Bacteroidales bacterium]|nr:sigma factor [Bacteroidales bacterium]
FVFNMLRNREISEDMVQNIFLRMMRYPDGFKGFGEFRMWMYHILADFPVSEHIKDKSVQLAVVSLIKKTHFFKIAFLYFQH